MVLSQLRRWNAINLTWIGVLAALTAPVAAQELYGSVVGTVQDGSGGHIPGATVTVVNRDTNLTLTAVINETGSYTFTNVLPGTYDVKISLQGFKEFVQANVPWPPDRSRASMRVCRWAR